MEILDQLGTKVKKAVQKIEELTARIKELEEINQQYEDKMKEMLQEMDPIEEPAQARESQAAEEQSFGGQQEERQEPYQQQF
ncbi:MAG: cell division protein ZapB [Proteobacteria bacterium]|nr:cell division protein ZapB [Pseudomonadota bacterium]